MQRNEDLETLLPKIRSFFLRASMAFGGGQNSAISFKVPRQDFVLPSRNWGLISGLAQRMALIYCGMDINFTAKSIPAEEMSRGVQGRPMATDEQRGGTDGGLAQKDGVVSFEKVKKQHFTGKTVPRTRVSVV